MSALEAAVLSRGMLLILLSVMQRWFIQQTVSILYTWQDTGQIEGGIWVGEYGPHAIP